MNTPENLELIKFKINSTYLKLTLEKGEEELWKKLMSKYILSILLIL